MVMALSGSLKEFELADIFQLIGQQKKTGRLVLRDGTSQAYCLFNRGMVVAAGSNSVDFTTVLHRYLVNVKKYPEKKVKEFVNVCKGSGAMFSDVVRKIQYVTDEEVEHLAQSTTEDLACALFFWHDGEYLFEPMSQVSEHILGSISFTTDALAMEAMRRADEWNRMREVISGTSVPVVADPMFYALPEDAPASTVLSNPSSYVLSKLDGSRCVADLIEESYLLEYQIYEILFSGLQSGSIRLLSDAEIARSSRLHRRSQPEESTTQVATVSVAAVISATVIILTFFFGVLILPRVVFNDRRMDALQADRHYRWAINHPKTTVAKLQFHAKTGQPYTDDQILLNERFLSKRDLPPGQVLAGKP